ncbi:MAG: hypothetical protein HY912_19225 [Desulfomonile tiedjei]|uniref:Uncharacterized protein n=1 Tax=Desulfomonile tiedjei TaxID=2358 RepID=A0A9D6V4Z7_9BACT|nr:hypothetical protein [Desulfomonile tiedjei]
MEILIGITIWVIVFLVWYFKTYPDKIKSIAPIHNFKMKWPRVKRPAPSIKRHPNGRQSDFKHLVETIESVCARDRFGASDAAAMVEAVKKLMEIEPSSGQIWEAYALDSLESAEITCDDCGTPVEKTVKKTGIKIHCRKCEKWLALKNSKVMIIDPSRRDLEDWEK